MEKTSTYHRERSVIRPGRNCWTYEQASHVSFLVDSAEYYSAVEMAVFRAKKSVYIAAWDIKTYALIRNQADPDSAITIVELLNRALEQNPELNIYILCWKRTLFFSNDREFFARLKWKIKSQGRLHFRLDGTQPLGSSHHQKIVVIDGHLAFCGGIDITDRRWDVPHHNSHVFRRDRHGRSYKPYHDVQVAVFGAPAVCLGDLFRDRWLQATGESLKHPEIELPSWPDFLTSDLKNIPVAIARTIPESVHEIAKLGTDAILSARQFIYIENQYLSSHLVVDVLERKLLEQGGPELVIILPKRYHGLWEKAVIGAATSQAIARLRSKDKYGKLGIFYLETINDPNHDHVKVHSKVLIIDNRFLKIGSANWSERSMGVDTECDLAIEANGDGSVMKTIESFLFRLLAEHSDCAVDHVRRLFEGGGSLLGTLSLLQQESSCRIQVLQTEAPLKEIPALLKVIVEPDRPWRAIIAEDVQRTVHNFFLSIVSFGSLMILLYLLLRGVFTK